jgi:hypothetical protein
MAVPTKRRAPPGLVPASRIVFQAPPNPSSTTAVRTASPASFA